MVGWFLQTNCNNRCQIEKLETKELSKFNRALLKFDNLNLLFLKLTLCLIQFLFLDLSTLIITYLHDFYQHI